MALTEAEVWAMLVSFPLLGVFLFYAGFGAGILRERLRWLRKAHGGR